MDKDVILAYIRDHEDEAKRRKRLFDYYRGRHDILEREMDDPSKPNNRLCNGFPAMISNAYAGYMHGEPVNYSADDDFMKNLNNTFRYNDEQAENAALGLDLSICGVAVEIHYMDKDAVERFKRVDPVFCIDVRDDSIEDALTALIRYYDLRDVATGKITRRIEVYEADAVTTYDRVGSELTEVNRIENPFGDVPAVVYQNNINRMGDFEGVLTLIDAYDKMQSESLNDQEYFSDAYLALFGLQGTTTEDVAQMKQARVLSLPADADARFLIKQQDGAAVEEEKTRLNNDIHRFSGCPDMTDENFAGNASGVAIKYKILQFEIIAGIKEREFKRGLQRRLELLCNIWRIKNRGDFDWRDVKITFKRSLPQNLLEISQALSNLGTLISDETKRAYLPMDIDEDKEKAQLNAQMQANMSLYPELFEREVRNDGEAVKEVISE